jgi:prepilin-type N-terminal cleavage/methylation domain-containing protein
MNKNYKFRCQGVTLIEILLVVGLLVILISFASPTISNATTRTQIQAEAENIRYSIRIARNTARMNETEVSMNVHAEPGAENHRISFVVSGNAEHSTGLQEYKLDGDFLLASDYTHYDFDGRGIVKNPGQIVLMARDDETVTRTFAVE